jgi:FHS family L-fucose permease-like MFS transporter
MAIAGGALVIVQGWLADRFGLQLTFLLTAACELYVLFYAVWGSRPQVSGGESMAPERRIE